MRGWLRSLRQKAFRSFDHIPTVQSSGSFSDPYQARLATTGVHQAALEAQLTKAQCCFDGSEPVFQRDLVFLGFTNRCGSNLLGEYLRQTGQIHGFGEFLNHDFVTRKMTDLHLTTIPEFIGHLNESCGASQVLGLKASWDQIQMLARWNILAMFPVVKMVHIRREDALAQAVSLQIANHTKQWTSQQAASSCAEDINVDNDSLGRLIRAQALENELLMLIAQTLNLPRHGLTYEKLCNDPDACIRQVLEFCGRPLPSWEVRDPVLQPQSGAVNQRIANGYLTALRSKVASGPNRTFQAKAVPLSKEED